MLPTGAPRWRIGAPRKVFIGGWFSGKPTEREWPVRSANRSGSRISGRSSSGLRSSAVTPEVMNCRTRPESSNTLTAPYRASVSERALSTTSRSTVSRSRLSVMRRLASLIVATRARCLSISCSESPLNDRPLQVAASPRRLRRWATTVRQCITAVTLEGLHGNPGVFHETHGSFTETFMETGLFFTAISHPGPIIAIHPRRRRRS